MSDSVWQLCIKKDYISQEKHKLVQSCRIKRVAAASALPATCQKRLSAKSESKTWATDTNLNSLSLSSSSFVLCTVHFLQTLTCSAVCTFAYLPCPVFSSLRCMVIFFLSLYLYMLRLLLVACKATQAASFFLFSKLTFKEYGEVYGKNEGNKASMLPSLVEHATRVLPC